MPPAKPPAQTTVVPGQTITTRYLPATATKGARVVAHSESGIAVRLSWYHGLAPGENHATACRMLANDLDWGGHWYGGETRAGVWTWLAVHKLS